MKKHHGVLFLILTSIVLTACDLSLPLLSSKTSMDPVSTSEDFTTNASTSETVTTSIASSIPSSSSTSDMPSSENLSSQPNPSSTMISSELSSTSLTTSVTSTNTVSSVTSAPTSSTSINSSQTFFTIASNAPTYYQFISPSATGESLKQALKTLISTSISVSYDWSRFESADESLTDGTKVLTIYPRRLYAKSAHVSGNTAATWNREHTYPNSKVSGNADNDNHHIFADDWKTNNERGNLRFGDVSNSEVNRVKDSSNLGTDNFKATIGGETFFEPNDVAKGEVARATLYLNTLYGYALNGNFQTDEIAVLWALQYPPTNRDMQRNNRVFTNQKNRNPYIDHRDYICLVYGMTSANTRQACGLA